jgi:hypothetical protein
VIRQSLLRDRAQVEKIVRKREKIRKKKVEEEQKAILIGQVTMLMYLQHIDQPRF